MLVERASARGAAVSDEGTVAKQDPAQEYWFRLGLRTVWLSADTIRYEYGRQKIQYPLSAVTRVGWGISRVTETTTFYAIPVNKQMTVTYHFRFGDDTRLIDVSQAIADTPQSRTVFDDFTDRVWRSIGVRLLHDVLHGLRHGKHYPFGDVVVDDFGVDLRKARVFRAAERVHLTWDQVKIWQSNGRFCIGPKSDEKLHAALPYAEANNAHVLEAGIRAAFKEGVRRLSDILYTDQRRALEARIRDLQGTLETGIAQLNALKSQIDGIRDQANGGVPVDQQEFDRLVAEHNGLLERLKADHGILEQLTADYKVSYG
jgi:hypothetical protein